MRTLSSLLLLVLLVVSFNTHAASPITISGELKSGEAFEIKAWGNDRMIYQSGNRDITIYDENGRYLERNLTGNRCYFMNTAECFHGNNFDTIVLYGADYNRESLFELGDLLSELLDEDIQLQYDSESNLLILLLDINGEIVHKESLKAEVYSR